MSDYGPGDRVRVTFETVVDTDGHVSVTSVRGNTFPVLLDEEDAVTVVERAKPEWAERPGAVVLDRQGDAWQFDDEAWECTLPDMSARGYAELVASWGPLTLIHDPCVPKW